jgi:transposase
MSNLLADKLTLDLICGIVRIKCPPKHNPAKVGRPFEYKIRDCASKILIILQTGQSWRSMGKGYSTYNKAHNLWSDKGVYREAFDSLQKMKEFANSMGTDFYIDASVIRNKCGIEDISHCYKIKCKRSSKITVIMGSNGLPVSLCVSKSSVHDINFVLPALNKIKLRKRKIKSLVGDTGYMSLPLKNELRSKGINLIYGQKRNLIDPIIWNNKEKKLFDKRYKVEGIFSTLYSNRRLNVRYERKTNCFESFIHLAMIHMIFKKLGPIK